MKLKDGGKILNAGINELFLQQFFVEQGSYGKQLVVEFSRNPEIAEDEKLFKGWVSFKGAHEKGEASTWLYGFQSQLRNYLDLVRPFNKEADSIFNDLYREMEETSFDEKSKDDVQNLEESFVTQLFKKCLPKGYNEIPVNVILHYNDKGFLTIPYVKQNSWNLPFGENPILGDNLNMVKPERTTGYAEFPTPTDTPTESGDLPF